MRSKRTTRSWGGREFWSKQVADWKRSGLKARQFAASRDLPLQQLYWWQWRLSGSKAIVKAPPSPVSLARIEVLPDALDSTSDLGWELRSRDGDVLRVRGTLSAVSLSKVLSAMLKGRRR